MRRADRSNNVFIITIFSPSIWYCLIQPFYFYYHIQDSFTNLVNMSHRRTVEHLSIHLGWWRYLEIKIHTSLCHCPKKKRRIRLVVGLCLKWLQRKRSLNLKQTEHDTHTSNLFSHKISNIRSKPPCSNHNICPTSIQ